MSGYEDIVQKGIGINTTHLEVMYQDLDTQSSGFPDVYRVARLKVFSIRMRVLRTNLTILL
jgi:hypothetical protein